MQGRIWLIYSGALRGWKHIGSGVQQRMIYQVGFQSVRIAATRFVKISPRVSQKQLRFGDDVGKREFIKFVTFVPRAPQNPPQNDDAARAHDLKRRARDIARDSHGMEDQIRAMVSSYMAPEEDDEDPELMIGRLD